MYFLRCIRIHIVILMVYLLEDSLQFAVHVGQIHKRHGLQSAEREKKQSSNQHLNENLTEAKLLPSLVVSSARNALCSCRIT